MQIKCQKIKNRLVRGSLNCWGLKCRSNLGSTKPVALRYAQGIYRRNTTFFCGLKLASTKPVALRYAHGDLHYISYILTSSLIYIHVTATYRTSWHMRSCSSTNPRYTVHPVHTRNYAPAISIYRTSRTYTKLCSCNFDIPYILYIKKPLKKGLVNISTNQLTNL